MIPRSFFGRLAEPSPQQTERDLARLIHRTAELAAAARHQIGFAAVNLGCDGVRRVTMFDGSSCQTSGDVCLATREEGITVCLDAPRGNGLNFQRVAFSAPDCAPVTGWWLLDSEGYLYRVPAGLIAAAPYWPMVADPTVPEPAVTLVRAGTWAKLMCGAELEIDINASGGAEWFRSGESDWGQRFAAIIGGDDTSTIPRGQYGTVGDVWEGVLLRDHLAANSGSRAANIPEQAAPEGVCRFATVAYGYPFGAVAEEGFHEYPSDAAPWMRSYTWDPPGTWQTDTVGRIAGDMALVYRIGLAVAYGNGNICLDGPQITDPSDYVPLPELNPSTGAILDATRGVIALPGGQVALFGTTSGDIRSGRRYRVRPAPATALSCAVEQQSKGVWGDDPNAWVMENEYAVQPWLDGATSFDCLGAMGTTEAPGRSVPVVLWEKSPGVSNYLEADHAYYGWLGETIDGMTSIDFEEGTTVVASTAGVLRLTVIGPHPEWAYGWTFEIEGFESALSPLIRVARPQYGPGSEPLASLRITVPGGPGGTTIRRVYRYAWDADSTLVGAPYEIVSPWTYGGAKNGTRGAIYDRMCRLVKTIVATSLEPGTDPIDFYDEDTSLSSYGTRPPSPLVYLGPITVDAPRPVYLLQPLNL